MFRFANQSRVFWPVELASRGADGEPVKSTAYIGYQLLDRDELRKHEAGRLHLIDAAKDSMADYVKQADAWDKTNIKLLRERIYGWRDIVDNADVPLVFSRETLDALLRDSLLFPALLQGLFEASRGAKEKNSLPGPGGAPAPAQRTTDAGSGTAKADGATSPANTAPAPVNG